MSEEEYVYVVVCLSALVAYLRRLCVCMCCVCMCVCVVCVCGGVSQYLTRLFIRNK